eukprot:CAMPEP_0204625310 /NCGR_PEP_ID=MMETSP0717-20131115/11070_1 /ASSEMBLY_ACC=CAM_ASM_000666 /TAXON_ID=230516 /ORGANISM="Chaetoceros curvisetus" /LENGTH=257 /DNA_ID=CAMNT_0051640981 /DNA_START=40 /DNA_END=810 /DNA_ORIENTATION=-
MTTRRNTVTCIGSNIRSLTWHLKASPDDKDNVSYDPEVVMDDEYDDEDADWIPDREIAKKAREHRWKPAAADFIKENGGTNANTGSQYTVENELNDNINDNPGSSSQTQGGKGTRLTYTDEEEELIEILGGKDMANPSPKREIGFLGDSTLREIAMDFQVPICYLADVLCGWGVPPPIDPNGLLGDMVTGEQAFAILEAIHTLDVGSLNDRYAEYDLATLCNEYDIELTDAFELAMKEGWNLPFGVRTFLHVEQEDF